MKTYQGNPQAMFDDVVAHLRKQNCKAMEGSNCLYRASEGRMCGIGGIIPDEMYRENFEGMGIHALCNNDDKIRLLIGHQNITLAQDLQSTHDNWEVHRWEERFQDLANRYGLTYIAPEKGN